MWIGSSLCRKNKKMLLLQKPEEENMDVVLEFLVFFFF